jgi:hypothetical protein
LPIILEMSSAIASPRDSIAAVARSQISIRSASGSAAAARAAIRAPSRMREASSQVAKGTRAAGSPV